MGNNDNRGGKTGRTNNMDTDRTMPAEVLKPKSYWKLILMALLMISLFLVIIQLLSGDGEQVQSSLTGTVMTDMDGQDGDGAPETVSVESGTAVLGTDRYSDDNNSPVRKIEMQSFKICKYEITNLQYSEFIRKTVHQPPSSEFWPAGHYRSGEEDFPVTGISRDDAADYCRFYAMRLPTEDEWEYAARTENGYYYPWGDAEDISGSNVATGYPVKIGASKRDVNSIGIHDLSGNVSEWTSSEVQRKSLQGYDVSHFVIRGGSWEKMVGADSARLSRRGFVRIGGIHSGSSTIGFRCVMNVE